jgi:hypothetical protein
VRGVVIRQASRPAVSGPARAYSPRREGAPLHSSGGAAPWPSNKLRLRRRLLGIITSDDAADVLEEEATEDIEKLGG